MHVLTGHKLRDKGGLPHTRISEHYDTVPAFSQLEEEYMNNYINHFLNGFFHPSIVFAVVNVKHSEYYYQQVAKQDGDFKEKVIHS